jgi:ribonuclease P protein component
MLSRSNRLTNDQDFSRVYRQGRQLSTTHLRLSYMAPGKSTNQNISRFGFVVSKKHAVKIVDRNRVKRILRDETRKQFPRFKKNVDVVVAARPGIAKLAGSVIREEYLVLLEKAKL